MSGRRYKNIEVRGVVYADTRAAAEALGVRVERVRAACRQGTLDALGLGSGAGHRVPVRIAGRDFPSMRHAAEYFGCTTSAICKAITDGDPDRVARKPRGGDTQSKPIVLGGIRFPSMAAASRAIGRSNCYVASVLRDGKAGARESMIGAVMAYVAKQGRAA